MLSFFANAKTKVGQIEIINKSGHLKLIASCTLLMFIHLMFMQYFESQTALLIAKTGGSQLEEMNRSIMKVMPTLITVMGAIVIILVSFLMHIKVDYQRQLLSQTMFQTINEFQNESMRSNIKSMIFMNAMVRLCNHLGLINFPDSKKLPSSTQEEIKLFKQQRDKLFGKFQNHPELSCKTLLEVMNMELSPEQIDYLKQI